MSMAFEEVGKHARALSLEEKAALARILIEELDAAEDPEQLLLETYLPTDKFKFNFEFKSDKAHSGNSSCPGSGSQKLAVNPIA